MKTLLIASVVLSFVSCGAATTSQSDLESRHGITASGQSDLDHDLSLPLGQLGTPFGNRNDDVALASSLKSGIASMISRCVVTPFQYDYHGMKIVSEAKSICPELPTPSYDEQKFIEKVSSTLNGVSFTAVSFDGTDSDGGDQSDLAIYNSAGKRIAVQTFLYGDDSVLGDLAAVADVQIKEVNDGTVLPPLPTLTVANTNHVSCDPISTNFAVLHIDFLDGTEKQNYMMGHGTEGFDLLNKTLSADGRFIIVTLGSKALGADFVTVTIDRQVDSKNYYDATVVAGATGSRPAFSESSVECDVR